MLAEYESDYHIGFDIKEISEEICVSENTIKFHVRNLLKKTGCKSRVELKTVYRSAH